MKFYTIKSASLEEEGVSSYKELWDKVKDEHKGIAMVVPTVFEKTYEEDAVTNRFHVVMSTAIEDRHGEIVYQNWQLDNFQKNPVFLDSHNYSSIEHILGKVHSTTATTQLEGDIEFALENPKGMLAFKLALGDFLNATSVGFIPKSFDEDGNITQAELLELSAVSVPANPQALLEKSLDMDIDVVEMKDGRVLSKKNLEKLSEAHKALGEVIKSAQKEDDEEEEEEKQEDEEEEKEEPKKTITHIDLLRHLKRKVDERNRVLLRVAQVLQDTKPQTLDERRRELLKKIRETIK